MLANEREDIIRKKLASTGVVYVNELVKELNVTSPTIRNDLDKLVEKHEDLSRIHGGVVLKKEEDTTKLSEAILGYTERSFIHIEAKQAIAKKAITLINDGETILLDSSSSCFALATLLAKTAKKVTVITNGLSSATILKQNTNLTVIIIGGLVKTNSNTIYDDFDSRIYEMFHIDKYFFSASGLSQESGFSEFNLLEVKNKHANIQKAKHVIALIDSTKFDRDSTSTFAALSDADYLVTDTGLSKENQQKYASKTTLLLSE